MSEPYGAVLLYERCRAYTIASKVIEESMLSPDQKEELIAQLFAPVINREAAAGLLTLGTPFSHMYQDSVSVCQPWLIL